MENQKRPIGEEVNPVSRKTNEEIDTDEEGNLIIGGRKITEPESVGNDEHIDDNDSKAKNNSRS